MMTLRRIRYNTMNSWNNATAPAYNLKVHNVINPELRAKVYELMDTEGAYEEVNELIREFDKANNYLWQAGLNGRSGGYLVLYKGGSKTSEYKRICYDCGQKNFSQDAKTCGRCNSDNMHDYKGIETFTWPGKTIEEGEAPAEVLKRFAKLARDIVKQAEYMAKHCTVKEEEYQVTKTRKILDYK